MQKPLLIILNFLFSFSMKENVKFDVVFAEDYKSALEYLQQHKTAFKKAGAVYHHQPELLYTIVFPELMRYSLMSDLLETSALEYLYVNHGGSVSDFSIGHFQMKPSFVEQLETEIAHSEILKKEYAAVILYPATTPLHQRAQRLQRLKSAQWQLVYLNAFVASVELKTKNLSFKTMEDSLKFYAAAYNSGFTRPPAEIIASASGCFFPYGARYKGAQYAYADVALYFHRQTFQKKNPSKVPL